jgi:type II secretory pathway pseudopilin PulG
MSNPLLSSSSGETQSSDSPITVSQMNQMVGQMLQQVFHQQQETIQQQVHTAMETAMRQFQQQHQHPVPPVIPSSTTAASTATNTSSNPGLVGASHAVMFPSPLPPKVKISSPSSFTGALSTNVNSWLFEMDRYLTLCNVTSDDQRVAVASSYLKETASKWWENRCRLPNPPIQHWQSFSDAIRERFQPLAASRTARTQLHHLQQGNMSISDYCTKFYNLVQLISDMGEADQVHLFVSSLRSAISREVDMRDPKTLNEAMTLAQKVETLR